MKVLAIDPGTEKSGYVIWDGKEILEKGKISNNSILDKVSVNYLGKDTHVCVEMIASYGMTVGATTFETGVWIGRFLQRSIYEGLYTSRIFRKDVKMYMCNSTRAKDSNIRQSIIDVFGEPGKKNNPNKVYNDSESKMAGDIWQAFALALTFDYKTSKNSIVYDK